MPPRKVYFDVMRIVAIVLVLYNHLPAFHLCHNGEGAALVGGLAMSTLTRINVPLFAMLSGALLLGRTETYGDLWRKRISRMLLVVLIFEAAIYVEFHFTRDYECTFRGFLYGMLGGTLRGFTSYWFLYAYLGFLVTLPFLRMVARQMGRADFLWLVAFQVVATTVVPVAGFAADTFDLPAIALSESFKTSLSTVSLYFYPLVGYWLDRNIDVGAISRRLWGLMGLAVVAGLALSGLLTWLYNSRHGGFAQGYLGLTAYMTTAYAFLAFKRIFGPGFAVRCPLASRVLGFVSGLVFGVYLMDQALKLVLYEEVKPALTDALGTFGFSLAWCVISLTLCGAATWALKRVPIFHKIL